MDDHLLGVMQGRLLPKYNGRYQAHPMGYWEDEFPIASRMGLMCIEFILDFNDAEDNPLLTAAGRHRIREVSARTGVQVCSVCADYFMEAPLHDFEDEPVERSCSVLEQMLDAAQELGIRDVVIPCVDQSSIQDLRRRDRFCEVLGRIAAEAAARRVNLSLETDLDPRGFAELLTRLDSPHVTVNYDIGNSAALGYDPAEELQAYGERISDIHIKDRVRGGGSVPLGTGDADIPGFLWLLARYDYDGPFILQAFRDDEGIKVFKKQLTWLKLILGDVH